MSALMLIVLAGCADEGPLYIQVRVYSSPYEEVDWSTTRRLLSQHHDHVFNRVDRLFAYDRAGYDVVSLMDYSGNPSLPYALRTRLWPHTAWLSRADLSQMQSIKFFIPNAEEVGFPQHSTSPFLTSYIEVSRQPEFIREGLEYRSLQHMFSLIRSLGGLPCVAHPWDVNYEIVPGTACTEIYSAFAAARRRQGDSFFALTDRNQRMMRYWDRALASDQRIVGIAVNDHFGPYASFDADVVDSGKIIVLANSPTPAGYRSAFESGAVLAVVDRGETKGGYPDVRSITVDDQGVAIDTNGSVIWISHGRHIADGSRLLNTSLPPDSRYVRAEIIGNDRSTVYTQAFVVRPVGDVDGDYSVDGNDASICASPLPEADSIIAAACRHVQ